MFDGQNPDIQMVGPVQFDKIHSIWLCWEEDLTQKKKEKRKNNVRIS